MTARGSALRIWWDHDRGCCEAGPPPSMPRCRVSIHENLERILWLRKRRRRKRPRRRRSRKPRRSEFWPGWSAQLRPGSQLRVRFGEWRAAGPPFWFVASVVPANARTHTPRPSRWANRKTARVQHASSTAHHREITRYRSLRSQGRLAEGAVLHIQAGRCGAFSAPRMPAWRRVRRSRRQSCGAARPSPAGG
jgi:hypothetical protein